MGDGAYSIQPSRSGSRLQTTFDFGLWTLDFGLWTLDFGLWTLDFPINHSGKKSPCLEGRSLTSFAAHGRAV